ncbi:hypothetical protein [Ochrobactrum soli]|uniref:Uncharacterized protein n=1 Tax=Ochrobactrum soli TaxID=2448455 RepID=A0A2P9HMP7_9HYPH|nr:hypothetical protein [[Ochrobactrum] soli]SPL65329.1 hypothetical protein OHAE_1196 [[Ochrobactrum] soli]
MNDLFKEHMGFMLATAGGLIVSVLSSERHSFLVAVTRVAAGLFCATVLADPFIDFMQLEPGTYRNGVAGLFAMMGYALTRFTANIDGKTLLDFVRALRGGK